MAIVPQILCAALLALLCAPAQGEKRIVSASMERWRNVDISGVEGHVDGEKISVGFEEIETDGRAHLKVSASASSRQFSDMIVAIEDWPHIDLGSANVFARSETNGWEILVRIKISEPRDCFVNDDGRDFLDLIFSTSDGNRATVQSWENCQNHDRLEVYP